MTRLYFDTNIYRYINATSEIKPVLALLSAYDCTLFASSSNLFETYAIACEDERSRELRALVTLADAYDDYPESWLHALELRRAIKRHRPKWLRTVVSKRSIHDHLKNHRAQWQEAVNGDRPDPASYAQYRRDFEGGIRDGHPLHQRLRQELRTKESGIALNMPGTEPRRIIIDDPEEHWRLESLTAWYGAIEEQRPAARDYRDWLGPYLRPHAFRDHTYQDFWFKDVTPEDVPLNRLLGLIGYYQLTKKLTHGNATDQLHATHWLTKDLFITADQAFHSILTTTATNHYPDRTLPALVDRGATSATEQLHMILDNVTKRPPPPEGRQVIPRR